MIFQPIGVLYFYSKDWFVGLEKYFEIFFPYKITVGVKENNFNFGRREVLGFSWRFF